MTIDHATDWRNAKARIAASGCTPAVRTPGQTRPLLLVEGATLKFRAEAAEKRPCRPDEDPKPASGDERMEQLRRPTQRCSGERELAAGAPLEGVGLEACSKVRSQANASGLLALGGADANSLERGGHEL